LVQGELLALDLEHSLMVEMVAIQFFLLLILLAEAAAKETLIHLPVSIKMVVLVEELTFGEIWVELVLLVKALMVDILQAVIYLAVKLAEAAGQEQ
jgi:hypothetical protein